MPDTAPAVLLRQRLRTLGRESEVFQRIERAALGLVQALRHPE